MREFCHRLTMDRQAVPGRAARLGRAVGSTTAVDAAILLLPEGRPEGTRPPSRARTAAATLPLARRLVRAGEIGAGDGTGGGALVCHALQYRFRGWNGRAAHPVADTAWALDELLRRYGDVPVCLIGTGMGARAALHAAGHAAVQSVVALAPWLPPEPEASSGGRVGETSQREPVQQLEGRQVLIVHGSDDRRTDPDLTYRLALRARQAAAGICRFEVHTDGHGLRQHRREVMALVEDFVLGSLCERDFARPTADALAAPPPLGLRMPLAAGFGRSLR